MTRKVVSAILFITVVTRKVVIMTRKHIKKTIKLVRRDLFAIKKSIKRIQSQNQCESAGDGTVSRCIPPDNQSD